MESIRELLIEEMKDLYDAEKQLVKALPKMVKAASNPNLSEAFQKHLEQTRGHVERMEQAFESLGEKAKGKPCAAMKGLIEEASETLQEDLPEPLPEPLLDSAIICAAQKVEHYEIAGYGTLKAWAEQLGLDDVANLLQKTLDEEKAADEKLTGIGGSILADAGVDSEDGAGQHQDGDSNGRGRKGAASKSAGGGTSHRRAG